MSLFPEDSAERKAYPVFSGFVQYFPAAMAAVAHHSWLGNEKHNPGLPLQWDRSKSSDEADADLRHLMEGDLVGHAWRAMAMLQKRLEAQGAAIAPAAVNAAPTAAQLRDPNNWPVADSAPLLAPEIEAVAFRDEGDNAPEMMGQQEANDR